MMLVSTALAPGLRLPQVTALLDTTAVVMPPQLSLLMAQPVISVLKVITVPRAVHCHFLVKTGLTLMSQEWLNVTLVHPDITVSPASLMSHQLRVRWDSSVLPAQATFGLRVH